MSLDHDRPYPDALLRDVLSRVKTVAVVGASNNPARASYFVMKYMTDKGYRILPVNPGLAGQEIHGWPVYASLKELPEQPDMVDIFRNSEAAGPVAVEAAEMGVPVVWMQIGVRNDMAAARAEDLGTTVIMNRCPKIEYARLFG